MNFSYSLARNGIIVRSDGASIGSDPNNIDYQNYLAWVAAGNVALSVPAPALTVLDYSDAIQSKLDGVARSWGYDDVVSAATYANSANSKFKGEALALIGWRDQVWAWAEGVEAAVSAGTQPAPASIDAFLAQMPSAPARPAS